MQIDRKDYNPDQHDIFKALSVKQPWADLLTRVVFRLSRRPVGLRIGKTRNPGPDVRRYLRIRGIVRR